MAYFIEYADENGIMKKDKVYDSDMEISAPKGEAGLAYPKGWCKSTAEREVWEFLKNTIEGALQGAALEVVNAMGMPRDRTTERNPMLIKTRVFLETSIFFAGWLSTVGCSDEMFCRDETISLSGI